MQDPGKGVNDAGLKASKQMQGNVDNSSLERIYLDTVLIESTEVHAPEKGINNAGPKALMVAQAPLKGSQGEILEVLQVMLGDIDGD